jgi:hypothetical protein
LVRSGSGFVIKKLEVRTVPAKQIGEFSFKLTSINFNPDPSGSVVIQVNREGTATNFGTVAGTLATIPGKGGTFTWCGAAYLDNGDLVTSTEGGRL